MISNPRCHSNQILLHLGNISGPFECIVKLNCTIESFAEGLAPRRRRVSEGHVAEGDVSEGHVQGPRRDDGRPIDEGQV